MSSRFIRTDDWYYNNGRIFRDKLNKLNDDRNKAYEHIIDEVENFIYQKGIIDNHTIETFSNTDIEKGKVSDTLTITINMSRDL